MTAIAERVIGPAFGRTRWLQPSYAPCNQSNVRPKAPDYPTHGFGANALMSLCTSMTAGLPQEMA